jgi:hypothetical protein
MNKEKTMRLCLLLAGCACLLALVAEAAEDKPKFELHEWGVFGVYTNVEYANADMKAEWESLPKFMYGFVKGKRLPDFSGIVTKPIIYIHTKDMISMSMTVKFSKGMPTVWYPAAANIVEPLNKITADKLEWKLGVNQPPKKVFKGIGLKLKDAQQAPWIELARKPESAQVFAEAGFGGICPDRLRYLGLFHILDVEAGNAGAA